MSPDYPGGTLLRRYVHGPGVDEYLVMYTGTGTSNKSYFHANHQGSIIAMSDGSGNVTEQHSYDSYGNSDDLTGNPFRYTGRRLDAETGLYYYRARYYSPAIGRFLQTDPIGYGDGLNWYAYVGNDPLNGTDPTGKAVFLIPIVIFIAKEVAGEAFEQATGIPAPTVKNAVKFAGKTIAKQIAKKQAQKQLKKNVAQGKKGEALTRAKLGDNKAGEQVTFKTSDGSKSRVDFVTNEKGGKGIVETKTGGAGLSPNQKKLFNDVKGGREVTPVGKNAEKARFKPGKPITIKSCKIDRPC